MTALADHQFEILPSEAAADGFVFGVGAEVSVNSDGFDTGENDWLNQDTQNSRRGVIGFGRDVLGGKTWTWESHVDQVDVETALDTLDRFSASWMPELLVRDPGAVTALRYQVAGRVRRVYGRPRRFAAPPNNLILNGFVPVTHDFQCVDSFTYSDEPSSANILYVSGASGGGFVLPATFPVGTLGSEGSGGGQLAVGGTARAYPVIRFNGPWTNPRLTTDDWEIKWTGEIPGGDWVEIDTRPWKLTVRRSSGASAWGGLDRKVWLEDCWFAPGSRPQIALSGSATGGTASALITWRDTWTSL